MLINTYPPNIQDKFWKVIDWLYPPSCCSCWKIGKLVCDDCFSSIQTPDVNTCKLCGESLKKPGVCLRCRTNPPHFHSLRSLGYFTGSLRDAVHSLKYQRNLGLGEFFSIPLAQVIQRERWQIDLITAVPLNKKRRKERGYNQAEILARPVAKKMGISYSSNLIQRIKHTNSQVGLSLQERQNNVVNAFLAVPALVKSKNVLIIDDVATTGSTMDACAKALMDAGTKNVFALTLAKTAGMRDDYIGTQNSTFRR
jgi:competence protein ComFC